MKLGVRLCVLVVFSLQLWAPGQGQELEPEQILAFCDDKDVEAAVDLALVKYNEKLSYGNQLALYQILESSKAQNDSCTQYFVEFNSRVTDCPAGGDKVWRDCDYLPTGNKVPRPCKATVHMSETSKEVLAVFCDPVEAPVVAERTTCLGCPREIDVDSEDLKDPLTYSITRFNADSDSSHHFILNSVGFATRQVVSGFRYRLMFDMRKSNCSKADHKELNDECHPDPDVELAHCNSTVDMAPWRHETAEANVECAPGPLETFEVFRRRPPGWSPLRNFNNFDEVKTTQASTASAKEESSEESQERSPTAVTMARTDPESALLSVAPTAAESPFHCPSKPWKQFVPPTIPSPEQEESTTPLPVVEGGLSDLELLWKK
ncbi:kininogen-1 [Coregonus clupeaformis]|uniref:Cystatin kininogen-type domain-containing protein n=1 Tax=Coregonus suidteri TaxID=861788 RepID=A0AAN8LGJ6_9TELE|nr:kininogen-1 [Coregonus clupeaformis]